MRGCRVMSKNQQKIYIHHHYYWINLPWDHGRMIDIVIKPNFKRSPETRREMRSCASSRRSVRVHDRLEGRGRARGRAEMRKEMVALRAVRAYKRPAQIGGLDVQKWGWGGSEGVLDMINA